MGLIHGDSSRWIGKADLIFTNPYAPIHECLHGKPAILSFYRDRDTNRGWFPGKLTRIGTWGHGENAVYVANLHPVAMDLSKFIEEGIHYPLDFALRMLSQYAKPGMTVWDGFMGRGTVGKACQILGLDFIGIDIDARCVEKARDWLAVL